MTSSGRVGILQARATSTRLPGKVLLPVAGAPMLLRQIERLHRCTRLDRLIVATSTDPSDDSIAALCADNGVTCHRGSLEDVLDRFHGAAVAAQAKTVVRLTGDCPLADPEVIDRIVEVFLAAGVDYASNTLAPTYPDGLDAEVTSFAALDRAWREARLPSEREHVTPYIYNHPEIFTVRNVAAETDLSALRWTVDEPADLDFVRAVYAELYPQNPAFSTEAVLDLLRLRPDIAALGSKAGRNEGYAKSLARDAASESGNSGNVKEKNVGTGQKLWKQAKSIIPGGNMLLSKRAEMFLPDQWPAYFSKAKGCRVWDLDGNEFIDMSIMGIGTNTLGYGHPEVDAAVRATIDAGNMSTFNCPEEVHLAERLTQLNPWADMVRFTRTGGEANAVAIRIARAATGKDKVAICGYHGWHDWYLAANLGEGKNLDGHLLPGLEPRGVPRELRETVLPFNYNRIDELEALLAHHDIGVIKMEVTRNEGPRDGFLQKVRDLATRHGIVLIFDECTSGFRQTFGGIYTLYGVQPDMALFSKAMGNGYAIAAVIGRREIMESAQSTFISSTFWTERIGPTAALATLDVMEREKSWERITATGTEVKARWAALANTHGLKINLAGIPALASFSFDGPNALAYKTLMTQEMLAKGYLASTLCYVCTEHTPEIVDGYFAALDPVFALIRECEDGRDVHSLLKGPVCHAGFKRLN